jgi:GAF domain-containing protein
MSDVFLSRETFGNRVATQRELATAAQDLFSADFCAVQAVNPITERLYADADTVGQLPCDSPADLIQEQLKSFANLARQQVGLYVEDFTNSSHAGETITAFKGLSIVTAIALHTKREKKPMAVLILGFRKRRTFKQLDSDLLKLFVDRWSPILENVWLLGRYREVVKIGQEINQTLEEPRDLFEQLFENVSKILNTKYFFMLAAYHQPNETIDYHTAYHGKIIHSEGQPLRGVCAYVIEKKEPVVEAHYSENPDPNVEFVSLLDRAQPDPESLIFVPLIFRDEPLGVLSLQQVHANAFDAEDLHIMTLLANQVALAISNLRLFGYLEALNAVGQQLTSQIPSDMMLDSVVERIREATKADIVTLYPYFNNVELPFEKRFAAPHTNGQLRDPTNISAEVREGDIVWLSLEKSEPIWAVDTHALFEMLAGSRSRRGIFETREEVLSTAVLTLCIEGESVGVLFINYRHRQLFKASQRNFICGLANFAAIAISNNRRFRDLSRHRLRELEVLRQNDLEISRSLNLKDVLHTILKRASVMVSGDEASIFLYNRYTHQLETEVSFGRNTEKYERRRIPIDANGLVPWVFHHKVPVRIGNTHTDPKWRTIYSPGLVETRSELDVPLHDDTDVVGVIHFESAKDSAFSEADESFLVTLAGQAVLAIKKAQIYERSEARRKSLESLHEVIKQIIGQGGDPERVIRLILSHARSLIGAEGAVFQQYEGDNPTKYYVDSSDEETRNSLIMRHERQGSAHELGIVKRVANTKQPYATIGVDAQDDLFYTGSASIHSEVAVPLIIEDDKLIGVLGLESPRRFAFDEEDERLLVFFVELAGIAIKNARDYSRATEESVHARMESKRFQLLWQAGSELSEIIEPSQLESAYQVVMAKVREFSDAQVVIRRYDSTTEELILVAVERERSTPPLTRIPKSEGINGQVARELRAIRVDNLHTPLQGIAQPVGIDPTINSLVVTPLIFEKSYYGNLVLSHEKPNSFSDADVSLLDGLAKQLAITLHRLEIAKAKQEVEQHVRNLRMMGEVGQSAMEIAHRLGNQLKPVDIYVENVRMILEREGLSHTEINDELNKVARDVKSLLNMAKGLRQKIADSGNLERDRIIMPVKALLEEAESSLHMPGNVEISQEIQENLPSVIVVPGQVIDILRNLFSNSIEAMPSGGRITIRASHVPEQPGNSPQYVLIEFADTGPGIPLEAQDKVFNLFFSTKKSSGFGLWSSRQYARANGGDLTLTSKVGQGATFTLSLLVA